MCLQGHVTAIIDTLTNPSPITRATILSKTSAHILMLIAAFIWGTTFVAQTTGMETIGPFAFTTVRYLIGAIALLPLAFIERRKIDLRVHLQNDRYLFYQTIGLGVMMFGGIALQQTALLYTQVANAAFLTALYVPAVPIFLFIFLRQPVANRIWMALILSLTGSWLLSGSTDLLSQWGDFLVAAGSLFWAGHIILIGLVMTKLNTPFQFAFIQNCLCVLFGLLPTILFEAPQISEFLPVLPELFYAGLFSVGIAYTLQMMAQGYSSTTLAAFILSLESVFAAISGWLLLGQKLSWLAIFGCTFIFAAIIIADVLPAHLFRLKKVK